MKIDQFNEITQAQIEYCLAVLAAKGKEYSLSDDRFDHFKESAAEQETTPAQALWGMLSKHLSSLAGMCRGGRYPEETWVEKITDSVNYLLLLRALIQEEANADV